jgi:putative oxidoreductase
MRLLNRLDMNIGLLILRLSAGGMMLTHGYPKLLKLFGGGEIQFFDFLGIGTTASLALAVGAEVVCSVLLMVGVKTRLVVLPLIFTMAVAAFLVHAADPFAKQEKALMYLMMYLTLLFTGGGKYAFVRD